MPKLKKCPVCNKQFNCMAVEIANCECNEIQLPVKLALTIKMKYADCICADCLKKLVAKETL